MLYFYFNCVGFKTLCVPQNLYYVNIFASFTSNLYRQPSTPNPQLDQHYLRYKLIYINSLNRNIKGTIN